MLLKDQNLEFKFTINTLCTMSEQGIDVMNLPKLKITMPVVRELVMYGLKHQDKKITQNKAGSFMDEYLQEGGTFDDLVTELMLALEKSLGGGKAKSEEQEQEEEGK